MKPSKKRSSLLAGGLVASLALSTSAEAGMQCETLEEGEKWKVSNIECNTKAHPVFETCPEVARLVDFIYGNGDDNLKPEESHVAAKIGKGNKKPLNYPQGGSSGSGYAVFTQKGTATITMEPSSKLGGDPSCQTVDQKPKRRYTTDFFNGKEISEYVKTTKDTEADRVFKELGLDTSSKYNMSCKSGIEVESVSGKDLKSIIDNRLPKYKTNRCEISNVENTHEGIEGLIISEVEVNTGQIQVAMIEDLGNGSYTIKRLVDINKEGKQISEEQNITVDEKGLTKLIYDAQQLPYTDRVSPSYLVEMLEGDKEEIRTGYEFMQESGIKYASSFGELTAKEKEETKFSLSKVFSQAPSKREQFLYDMAGMAITHTAAENDLANNPVIGTQIEYSKMAEFWRNPLTSIIPLPMVERALYKKNAGTGNVLLEEFDYNGTVESCNKKYATDMIEATNCTFNNISALAGKEYKPEIKAEVQK